MDAQDRLPDPDELLGGADSYLGRAIGRYVLDKDRARLVVHVRDSNAVSIHGCLFTVFAGFCVLVLGVMAMVSQRRFEPEWLSFVGPKRNHLGFLWLVSTAVLLIFLPFWMRRMHGASSQIVVSRTDRSLTVGSERVRLAKVEAIVLREQHDPDGALMVQMSVSHTDGMDCIVLEDYDEVSVRAVASELARYLGCHVVWS
jgi:hypothetical protein